MDPNAALAKIHRILSGYERNPDAMTPNDAAAWAKGRS